MEYAIIPIENKDQLSWTYAIPVGTWVIRRIEDNNEIKTYVGVENEDFTDTQQDEISNLEGITFLDCDCFFEWRDRNGVVDE